MNKRIVKKQIKKWLSSNELGDLRIGFDNDFMFDGDGSDDDRIFIAHERGDFSAFLDLCKELGYKGDYNIKTIAFLHELGHHFTCDEFDDEEEKEDQATRQTLYEIMEKNENEEKVNAAFLMYFRLPQEIEATKWAIDFVKDNPNETRRLDLVFN